MQSLYLGPNLLYLFTSCFTLTILYLQVWYRVIQIVINRDDVQGYAAKTVFEYEYVQSLNHANKEIVLGIMQTFKLFCVFC